MDKDKMSSPANVPSKTRVLQPNRKTMAAKWNARMLAGLQDALKKNPEADITSLLGRDYSQKLESFQRQAKRQLNSTFDPARYPVNDIRSRLCITDEVTVISELQPEMTSLLNKQEPLSEGIVNLLAEAEVLYEVSAASRMVFRLPDGVAVKIANEDLLATEHASLSYLKDHLPNFPTPKPLGLVRFGIRCLLFTTFITGLDLERAWPRLDENQKSSISSQLDTLFSKLRSLPFPENMPLGGVSGDGCKDRRRAMRVSSEPILDAGQFEDFIFSGSKTASPLYTRLLRSLVPVETRKCVFTHGDVRPANIMVDLDNQGAWRVVGVIDWEQSGFYPGYWECVKVTNNLTSTDRFDWYDHLPSCLSPSQYPICWLLDRVWSRSLANS
ncbi:kinase-like domain-containing protein [Coniochaeta sp. 2T2.1]|nr:kinase-like domain-containing protein [Coniochaeta sp. 2T2.1]